MTLKMCSNCKYLIDDWCHKHEYYWPPLVASKSNCVDWKEREE